MAIDYNWYVSGWCHSREERMQYKQGVRSPRRPGSKSGACSLRRLTKFPNSLLKLRFMSLNTVDYLVRNKQVKLRCLRKMFFHNLFIKLHFRVPQLLLKMTKESKTRVL